MIKQVKTKNAGILGIMRSAAFVTGFKEGQTGKHLRYDAYQYDINSQWDYERGRLLGLMFDGPLKVGKAVNRGAALYLALAFRQKEIL